MAFSPMFISVPQSLLVNVPESLNLTNRNSVNEFLVQVKADVEQRRPMFFIGVNWNTFIDSFINEVTERRLQ